MSAPWTRIFATCAPSCARWKSASTAFRPSGEWAIASIKFRQLLYLDLLRVFGLCLLCGIPVVLFTPPPSADFVELMLQRDVYRAATGQAPLQPTPVRLFRLPAGGGTPDSAHPGTATLPYHQVRLVQSFPIRYYGLRVPLAGGAEVWGESRLPVGYYQLAGSWASSLRWLLGLGIFYALLLGSSTLLIRRLRARLQALGEAAQGLAAGRLDTVCAADVRDPAEITLLVRRLTEMGTALRERHQSLAERRLQLERASAERNRRLAEVSHDLRTPLTSILGYAQLYHDQGFERLSEVEDQARALLSRVGRWLESCRLESGVLDVRLGEVHLHDALEEAVHLANQWQPLQAQVDLPAKSPVIQADSFLFPRILARLMLDLNCAQVHLTVQSPRLILQGAGPAEQEAELAQLSLEGCRQLLRRHQIRLDRREDSIELTWETPWSE